jgi:hypothetical protein
MEGWRVSLGAIAADALPGLTASRYEKPWVANKSPRKKWEPMIFYGSILIGFAIGALICYFAFASVTNHEVGEM